MAANAKTVYRFLDYIPEDARPHITLSVKIEREADTFYIYDMCTFYSLMYTFKHRTERVYLSHIGPEIDYKTGKVTNSMFIELRGGGYGSEVARYDNDPTTDKYTPGYQGCYYDDYRESFMMKYKDEDYEIPQPFNLTPEEGTRPSRYDDDGNLIRPEPTPQFPHNVTVSFGFRDGYNSIPHARLEAVSIIPKNIQLSRFRARMLYARSCESNTYIHSMKVNENGDLHIHLEKDDGWHETTHKNTPGYQRYDWDFCDGDKPYFQDRMFYHGRWNFARLPFTEKELEWARNGFQ